MQVNSNNLEKGHLLVDGNQLVEVVHVTPKRKFIHVINLTESKEVQPKRRLLYKPFEGSKIYKRVSDDLRPNEVTSCRCCDLSVKSPSNCAHSDCVKARCHYKEVQK